MSKAAVYADINPNIIDGSSIWMMSITEVLSQVFDEVWLVLKTEPTDKKLVSAVSVLDNVIIDYVPNPSSEEISVRDIGQCAARVKEIHAVKGLDAVVVRGLDACNTFCKEQGINEILWSYVTDLPFPPSKLSANGLNRLERVASRSAGLFSQTETSRSYYEALAPSAPGKTYLLPPMIPDKAFAERTQDGGREERSLEIVYAGKFAKDWKTLEMLELPAKLQERGVRAHLTVIGAKINRDKDDPSWSSRMAQALESAQRGEYPGVTAVGAVAREESLRMISEADLGIGWRTSKLDSSMEISTKALEYAAAGTPPVINRNGDHELLLGADYPFFVNAHTDVNQLADTIVANLGSVPKVQASVQQAVCQYSMSSAVQRLRDVFTRVMVLRNDKDNGNAYEPTKLLVASHDLKFAGELLSRLLKDPRFEIKFDHWESLHKHNEAQSNELAQWADVIFCEFAGPNLTYYSNHKAEDTRLIARLHGFETRNRASWFADANLEAVDSVLTVSEHYRRTTIEFLPELEGKVQVVPNMIDTKDFSRPKGPDARYHLGLVGMVPFLKRPDKALDLLSKLLEQDDRYYLHIKGRMPWDYPYVWKDTLQRHKYLDFFARLREDELLSNHVVFEPFSTDIASWLRGIGFVLSPSDEESFHLAPAEGMASGAVPIVWSRAGSTEVFGSDNVYEDLAQKAEVVLSARSLERFKEMSFSARQNTAKWNTDSIYTQWAGILSKDF